MMYQITIRKEIENPEYESLLKEWQEKQDHSYGRSVDYIERPSKTILKDTLMTFLDEKQYQAVQKAVLETFE